MERIFESKDFNDEKSCRYAIVRLHGEASTWYEALKANRNDEGKMKILS